MNMVHIWAMEIRSYSWLSSPLLHTLFLVKFPFITSLLEVPGYCSTHPVFQHEEYIIVVRPLRTVQTWTPPRVHRS